MRVRLALPEEVAVRVPVGPGSRADGRSLGELPVGCGAGEVSDD